MSLDTQAVDRENESKPFIPYLDERAFSPEIQELLGPYKKRMGFFPNALRFHARRPDIAAAAWRLNNKIMRDPGSTLDQFLKRRLSTIASVVNRCRYSVAHTCSILGRSDPNSESWGMTEAQIRALVDGTEQPRDEKERVCLDFVRAASADPTAVPQEIYARLTQLLTPEQIVELAYVVAFWKFYNTFNDCLQIPIESHLASNVKYMPGA
jgi:uncharacterized peroxidase-related enzyme